VVVIFLTLFCSTFITTAVILTSMVQISYVGGNTTPCTSRSPKLRPAGTQEGGRCCHITNVEDWLECKGDRESQYENGAEVQHERVGGSLESNLK
jgi:hypothetical protein